MFNTMVVVVGKAGRRETYFRKITEHEILIWKLAFVLYLHKSTWLSSETLDSHDWWKYEKANDWEHGRKITTIFF